MYISYVPSFVIGINKACFRKKTILEKTQVDNIISAFLVWEGGGVEPPVNTLPGVMSYRIKVGRFHSENIEFT